MSNAKKSQERKEKALLQKLEEEALDRKAKATVKVDYICSIRMFKNFVKRKSTIKQVTCPKCGKTFKTNRETKLCFNCEKIK